MMVSRAVPTRANPREPLRRSFNLVESDTTKLVHNVSVLGRGGGVCACVWGGGGRRVCVCVWGGGFDGEKGTDGNTWYCTAYSRILSVLFKQYVSND